MQIEMKKSGGVRLLTEGKTCAEDIDVIPKLEELDATENKTYTPSEGHAGFSSVNVNVKGDGLAINGIIKQYQVNAGAQVNAGDFVEFVNKYGEGGFGLLTPENIQAYRLSDTKILIAYDYSKNVYGVIAEIAEDGYISVGAQCTLAYTDRDETRFSIGILSESRAVIGYLYNSTYPRAYARGLLIDGLTITQKGSLQLTDQSTSVGDRYSFAGWCVGISDSLAMCGTIKSGGISSSSWNHRDIIKFDGSSLSTSGYTYSPVGYVSDAVLLSAEKLLLVAGANVAVTFCDSSTASGATSALPISQLTSAVKLAALSGEIAIAVYGDNYEGYATVIKIGGSICTIKEETFFAAQASYCAICALSETRAIIVYCGTGGYGNAFVAETDGTNITIGKHVTFSEAAITYADIIAISGSTAIVTYNEEGGGKYKTLFIDDMTITVSDDGQTGGTLVQPATSTLHNVGVAKTAGTEGETVDVFCVDELSLPVKWSISNCKAEGKRLWIRENSGTLAVTFTPDLTYALPDTVTVTGAEYTWNAETGELTVFNATSEVKITVAGVSTARYTATAAEATSATELTASVACTAGNLVVAAITTRDTLTLSDGWTLISTSEVNSTDTYLQRLSWAYKTAESTTESITVTQASAERIYINMVALDGATGVTDGGYTYVDDATVTSISAEKPAGLTLWGMSATTWTTASPYTPWTASADMPIIQIANTKQQRLGLALDQSEETSVTFTPAAASTMILGCLTVTGMDKFY